MSALAVRTRVKAVEEKVHEKIPPLDAAGPARRAGPILTAIYLTHLMLGACGFQFFLRGLTPSLSPLVRV